MNVIRKLKAIDGSGINKLGKKEFAPANHCRTIADRYFGYVLRKTIAFFCQSHSALFGIHSGYTPQNLRHVRGRRSQNAICA